MKEQMKDIGKLLAKWVPVGLIGIVVLGFVTQGVILGISNYLSTGSMSFTGGELKELFSLNTLLYGFVEVVIILVLVLVNGNSFVLKASKNMLKSKADRVEGSLENSRWMEDSERNELFPKTSFSKLSELKKDGIPLYAVYNSKKKDMDINIIPPAHGIIIGATGSGKTTTFVNPVVQILGRAKAGSSMICTDPKGELFQLHSKLLHDNGYNCMVLDLRDPYSSFRWNPLGSIYDTYQEYLHKGDDILEHTDSIDDYPDLKLVHDRSQFDDEEPWYEWEGCAYAVRIDLINRARVEKQKLFDETYEDLNDLISVICPIENEKDPVWEKGARSIIMATALAMLEDSEDPRLEMTKDKFCFYNINKVVSNSEDEFAALKDFFEGRSKLSKAVGLSRQVLSAADQTLSSYMSIAFDKLSMFNDEGLCALTSATDIRPEEFAERPTALFLKIPDEKDTRHALAAVFILCIYKALIKVASAREDLSLPRNVFFLLDEFGNMPKIDKFDKMITVGRSRKIWFEMIVQSFAQLKNVYGETVADIVKGNCGIKLFIGSNDMPTCEEFSKLCGNMTVRTQSVSSGLKDKTGNINVSTQLQQRPLIYPNELTRLNNSKSTGNSIVVTFNNYPLMTKFTPSYRCPLYEMGQMDLSDVRANVFFGSDVFYDIDERNYLILDGGDEEDTGEESGSEDNEEDAMEDGIMEDEITEDETADYDSAGDDVSDDAAEEDDAGDDVITEEETEEETAGEDEETGTETEETETEEAEKSEEQSILDLMDELMADYEKNMSEWSDENEEEAVS